MLNKLLKSLTIIVMLSTSAAQAEPVASEQASAEPAVVQISGTRTITMDAVSHNMAMQDCCQSKSGQPGCQHCQDKGCDSGTCSSCSHCITALLHYSYESSDSDPAYRHQPVHYFLTFYQATDPRPPRT